MDPTNIFLGILLIVLLVMAVRWWLQNLARERVSTLIKAIADREKIDILYQDRQQSLIPVEKMILKYDGQEFFFVEGAIVYISGTESIYRRVKGLFLIAVGESAVHRLSRQEPVIRQVAGSSKLAAFSIYHWNAFAQMLIADLVKSKSVDYEWLKRAMKKNR